MSAESLSWSEIPTCPVRRPTEGPLGAISLQEEYVLLLAKTEALGAAKLMITATRSLWKLEGIETYSRQVAICPLYTGKNEKRFNGATCFDDTARKNCCFNSQLGEAGTSLREACAVELIFAEPQPCVSDYTPVCTACTQCQWRCAPRRRYFRRGC